MKLFFWDFQDSNDLVRYFFIRNRQWCMFIFNLCVLIFVGRALIKTISYYRRCIFQLVPLSVNFIAALFLLLLKLFEKGYEYDEISHAVEIFTYFLFCHTFALIYARIKRNRSSEIRKKVWNIVLLFLFIALITFSCLVFSGVIQKDCNQHNKPEEELPTILSFFFELIAFFPTTFYGYRIYNQLTAEEREENPIGSELILSKQQYVQQRRKQIKLVIGAYTISLILRLIFTIVTFILFQQIFCCRDEQGIYILTSDYLIGQILLILESLDQLLPHIVIPFAMYVIPLRKMSASMIVIDSEKEDDSDDDSQAEEKVQNRLSSVLTSRYS